MQYGDTEMAVGLLSVCQTVCSIKKLFTPNLGVKCQERDEKK